jgi:hypothetical protein
VSELKKKSPPSRPLFLSFFALFFRRRAAHKHTKTYKTYITPKGDDGSSTQNRFENDNENNENNENYFDDDDIRRRRKRRNTAERDEVRERGVARPVEQHFEWG